MVGLENAPRALMRRFAGENFGKQLLRLAMEGSNHERSGVRRREGSILSGRGRVRRTAIPCRLKGRSGTGGCITKMGRFGERSYAYLKKIIQPSLVVNGSNDVIVYMVKLSSSSKTCRTRILYPTAIIVRSTNTQSCLLSTGGLRNRRSDGSVANVVGGSGRVIP